MTTFVRLDPAKGWSAGGRPAEKKLEWEQVWENMDGDTSVSAYMDALALSDEERQEALGCVSEAEISDLESLLESSIPRLKEIGLSLKVIMKISATSRPILTEMQWHDAEVISILHAARQAGQVLFECQGEARGQLVGVSRWLPETRIPPALKARKDYLLAVMAQIGGSPARKAPAPDESSDEEKGKGKKKSKGKGKGKDKDKDESTKGIRKRTRRSSVAEEAADKKSNVGLKAKKQQEEEPKDMRRSRRRSSQIAQAEEVEEEEEDDDNDNDSDKSEGARAWQEHKVTRNSTPSRQIKRKEEALPPKKRGRSGEKQEAVEEEQEEEKEKKYEVEMVVGDREGPEGRQYLIRWVGFTEATWEPATSFPRQNPALLDYLHNKKNIASGAGTERRSSPRTRVAGDTTRRKGAATQSKGKHGSGSSSGDEVGAASPRRVAGRLIRR